MFTPLSRLFGFKSHPARIRAGRPERQTRLSLERLEDRLVPAGFFVDDLGDAGQGSGNSGDLRWCIQQVNASTDPNNTITFNEDPPIAGTIALQSALPSINKNVQILGDAPGQVIIQGNGNGANPYRIFTINPSVTVEIDNLTIEGGRADDNGGGGILNYGNLTLIGDDIRNNSAWGTGGGIKNSVGALLNMTNVVIELNSAESGGGIANYGYLKSSDGSSTQIIANNVTDNGGGIYNNGGKVYLMDSVQISGNTAGAQTGRGGGVFNNGGYSIFVMDGGYLANNDAANGGGLYNVGTATLDSQLVVQNNQAFDNGGGMYLDVGSGTTLNMMTIQNNTAGESGIGIYRDLPNSLSETSVTDRDD